MLSADNTMSQNLPVRKSKLQKQTLPRNAIQNLAIKK